MIKPTIASCLCFLALAWGAPAAAQDKARVVTTLAYLGEVARKVGGERVTVEVLAPPGQDPHFIVPTPARAVVLGRADVLIESGIQLELWSERVIDLARNQDIRPGSGGHTYGAQGIRPLQVPRNQTRASGDVHVGGNPHVWLDPLNLKTVAKNVEAVLANVRPAHAEEFAKNRAAFAAEIDEAFFGKSLLKILGTRLLTRLQKQGRLVGFLRKKKLKGKALTELAGGWLGRALALGDMTVISYHQVWTYFEAAFGIKVVGTIENKPGIPPSPGHLSKLQAVAEARGTKVVVTAPFYPFSRAEGVAERIKGQAIVLPTQPGEEGTTDLRSLFDTIFTRIESARAKADRSGE